MPRSKPTMNQSLVPRLFAIVVLLLSKTCFSDEEKMVSVLNESEFPGQTKGASRSSEYKLDPNKLQHDAKGAHLRTTVHGNRHLQDTIVGYGVQSHEIREGDIFPYNGWICKSCIMSAHGKVKVLQNPPKSRGISLEAPVEKYSISLGKWASTSISNCELQLVTIRLVDERKNVWNAQIDIESRTGPLNDRRVVHSTSDISVGKVFQIGKEDFVVTAIVPPDEKQQIIGWIVFDHVPLEEKPK